MNICKLTKMHYKVSLLRTKMMLSQFPTRAFCQEYTKTATIKEDEQLIQKARQNIEKKTKDGVKTLKVMQELEYDKDGYFYNRKLYYDTFISKMFQIYNSEKRQQKFINKSKNIHASTKEIVSNTLNPPIVTLETLVKSIKAKGLVAPAFDDFTKRDLEQSTYITHLIEEIQFSLLPGNFFPPHHIASTVTSLAHLNYKNSELVPKIREKMLAIIENKDELPKRDLNIDDIVFGEKRGRTTRTNVYRGFKDSNEFFSHVETLLKWQSKDESIALKEEINTLDIDKKKEIEEIVDLMKNILSVVEDTKSIQKEMGEAIESVRSQFSKISDAFDKYEFLQNHRYIKYDLLELEEKMVEAGLLDPSEAIGKTPIEEMPFLYKMRRATEVFYDLSKDYFPEMAPNTENLFPGFYKKEKRLDLDLKRVEKNNQLNLKYIGWILGKLSEMKESVRKDVVDKEFMHKYFREKCYISENFNDPYAAKPDLEYDSMNKPYTRFWNEVTLTYNSMFPKIIELLNSENPLSHLLMLNYGLTQGNVIDKKLHSMVESSAMKALKSSNLEFDDIELIHSIQGLAQSTFDPKNIQKILNVLKTKINKVNISKLGLNEKLRLAWGLCALESFDSKVLKAIVDDLNNMPFEHAQNELSYSEFLMLKDIYYALEYLNTNQSINESVKITNYQIKVFAKGSSEILKDYPETKKRLDPFKQNVLNGISKVLSKGDNKNSQVIQFQTEGEASKINDLKYPYTPDLLFQNKGETIALWLLNRGKYDTGLSSCNKNENGTAYSGNHIFQSKILQKLNPDKNIRCVYLNVEDLIDYDLENLTVNVNTESIVNQLSFLQQNFSNVYIDDLASLGKWFIDTKKKRQEKSSYGSRTEAIEDSFIDLIGRFFDLNQVHNDRTLNITESSINSLKSTLLKLSLLEDCLTPETKSEVERFAQEKGHSNFQGLLLNIKQDLDSNFKTTHLAAEPKVEKSWVGVRYGVEVPALAASNLRKDLSIELMNRNFMWTDDYFHYNDWAEAMKETYDGFNLCVNAPLDAVSDEKYFYQDRWRRTPKGIFPNAKAYRKISFYNVKDSLKEAYLPRLNMLKHKNSFTSVTDHNENKPMMVEEFLKERKPVTAEMKMITSLQNIKNSLKKIHSDSEILSFMTNLDFIDTLIGDHLQMLEGKSATKSSAKLVSRDPTCYREFLTKLDNVKDRYDPYTNFFIKEGAEHEAIRVTLPRKIKEARTKEERDKYQEVLDNLLLTEDSKKYSGLNVGTHVFKKKDIHYRFETLIRDENNYNRDTEVYSADISDAHFLDIQRRRAETNLIKTKIISKLHENKPLTENEKKYIKLWNEKLNTSRFSDLNNCMVPNNHSEVKIKDLNQADKQSINNVKFVDINGLNDFAVNDIVLELNHFLDGKTLRDIEKEVFIENKKNEWGLSSDFTLTEARNKEIELVLGEIEEKAYRYSGKLEDFELKGINKMFNVKRGEGVFDQKWQEIDQKEYDSFDFNNCDDRLELLEKWFNKKEREIKTRIHLPDKRMLDYSLYQNQLKEKTIELISKVFGKKFNEITTEDLNEFVEGLCQRLIMFNGSFPNFLPHLVREIINHPNLNVMDKEQLESYCNMFEFEWKENPDQPLWLSNIYTKDSRVIEDDLNEATISKKLQKAGIPYISNIKRKILENN